jgi:hypothetical protein
MRFENEIDIDVTFIGLDTTKMDAFFNKPIKREKEVNVLKLTKPKTSRKRKHEKMRIKQNRLFERLEKNKQ